MFPKYLVIVTEAHSNKPFVTFLEYDDANDALDALIEYDEEKYDVALYRRMKHEYNNL